MKKLLLFLALPLAASQDAPKKPSKHERAFIKIRDIKKEVPEAGNMFKALAYLDFTMKDNIKKLQTLKDSISQAKLCDYYQIQDAKKWMAEVEMVSLFITGLKKDSESNLIGIKEWQQFITDLEKDLWFSKDREENKKESKQEKKR